MLRYKVYAKQARVSYPGGNVQSQPECQKLAGKIGWVFVCTFWTKNFLRLLIFFQNLPLRSSIFLNLCLSLYWHERSAFQLVAVQEVDWHDATIVDPYCQAQFKFSTSSVQFELRLALSLIITTATPTPPPPPTRESRDEIE